MYMGKCKNKWY